MSVRAGLANVERGDVGVRRPQQQPAQQQQSNADLERYNTILESEKFRNATPLQQATTVASWNLTPEQRAPLMTAIKARMQQQRQTSKYNRLLQSESFQQATPLQQLTTVASWDLSAEQKAPVVAAIKSRVQSQKDIAAQVKEQTATMKAPSTSSATPTGFTDPISKQLFANIAGAQEMQKNPARYALKKSTEIAGTTALLVAPAVAVPGALISTGISQAFKSVSGGGLLTGEEAGQAALGGAAFSVVGAGAVKALGVAGSGLRAAAGRVAVSTGFGAGVGAVGEYASTGRFTGEGALTGAAYGAAFGLIGEGARYGIGKVSSFVRGRLAEHDLYRRVVGDANKQFQGQKLTLAERLMSRVSPERAAVNRAIGDSQFKEVSDSSAFYTQFEKGGFRKVSYQGVETTVSAGKSAGQLFKQQILYRQASQVKAPMKNFAFSMPKMAKGVELAGLQALTKTMRQPRTITRKQQAAAPTMQVRRQQTEFASISSLAKPANPFLQFSGKPYYQPRTRVDEETAMFIVYPSHSPLTAPSMLPIQHARMLPSSMQSYGQLSDLDQQVRLIQEQVQEQNQMQQQKQGLRQIQVAKTQQRLDFVTEEETRRRRKKSVVFKRQRTRGRKRTYPILTGEEVLKLHW